MSSDATFSATLREVEGRTFITNHDTLLVVSAESGAKIAERRWVGQTNLVVHGVYANEIVVSHRLEKSPHTTTVQTLRLN